MKANRFHTNLIEPALLILFGILTTVVVMTGILPGLRPALVFLFLLVAPGLAYVRLLPFEDGFIRLTVAVALSLAIDAIIATTLMYARAWSYQNMFLIITAISMFGAIIQAAPAASETGEEEEELL